MQVLDGRLHSVETRLIHKADQSHTDNHHFGVVGHIVHHLLELGDGAEENRTIKALYVYMFQHLLGDSALVAPGAFLIEVGHHRRTVAAFDQVAGALHKQHAGNHHTDAHSGQKVHKHSQQEYHDKHKGVGFRYPQQVAESLEVDDAPANGDQDAGQNRQRNIFHQTAQAQQDGQQEQRMDHTAYLGAAAALHVDNGTHRCTGTGDAAEQTADHIANTLSHKFFVAVMVGLGDIVGHNRGQQGVNRTQTCQCQTWYDAGFQNANPVDACQIHTLFGKERHRKSARDTANGQFLRHIHKERHNRHYNQSHQCGWYLLGKQREEVDDGNSAQTQPKGVE